MVELPRDMQRRREVEDRAVELGQERAELDLRLDDNTAEIKKLLADAVAAGVSMESFAKMVGVSRQTLHQWTRAGSP